MTQYTLVAGALSGVATSALAFYNYYLLRKPAIDTLSNIVLTNMSILGLSAFGLGVGSALLMSKELSVSAILVVLFAGLNVAVSVSNTVAITSMKTSLIEDLKKANLIIGAAGATGLLVLVLAMFAHKQKSERYLL